MTLNDLERLFDAKIRFRPALLESERLNVKKLYNLCDSAVFCALHDQLASLGRHIKLTRCFSAVAELLVCLVNPGVKPLGNPTKNSVNLSSSLPSAQSAVSATDADK